MRLKFSKLSSYWQCRNKEARGPDASDQFLLPLSVNYFRRNVSTFLANAKIIVPSIAIMKCKLYLKKHINTSNPIFGTHRIFMKSHLQQKIY